MNSLDSLAILPSPGLVFEMVFCFQGPGWSRTGLLEFCTFFEDAHEIESVQCVVKLVSVCIINIPIILLIEGQPHSCLSE